MDTTPGLSSQPGPRRAWPATQGWTGCERWAIRSRERGPLWPETLGCKAGLSAREGPGVGLGCLVGQSEAPSQAGRLRTSACLPTALCYSSVCPALPASVSWAVKWVAFTSERASPRGRAVYLRGLTSQRPDIGAPHCTPQASGNWSYLGQRDLNGGSGRFFSHTETKGSITHASRCRGFWTAESDVRS